MRAKPNRTLKVMGPTAFEEDFRLFPAGQMNQYRVGDSLIIRGISGYSVSWNHSLQGISKAKVHFLK
jgi:hypothetical protein